MDLRHLRYFVAVAEAGHMTRAAQALGIQQPPLSQQIKALEQELGLRLFQRHAKGVHLTDAGVQLLDEARRLLADVAAMQARLQRVARGERGLLQVAFTSSAAAHAYTPRLLRECRRRYPEIALQVSESSAAEITDSLVAGRLHAGLLRVPVARPPGLQFLALLDEPALLALPVDHPLLRASGGQPRPVALHELRDEPLILVRRPGAPGLYANLLALCEAAGFQPRIAAEVERMMSNLNLVAAGMGVSVVPASMRGAHPDAIVYCPLADGVRLDAPLTLVWRDNTAVGPVATFVALARTMAQEKTAP
ncbi:MAG: LysR family transcriptional regulator [Rubrivivax sp.]|nr:LysR family transcriptional regulator [Rubrivivax sp.]